MAEVRLVWNKGLLREIAQSAEVAAECESRARRVLSAAAASAPIGSGDYRASLRMTVYRSRRRVKARVITDDPAGAIIERRTGNLASALGAARG